MIGREKEKEEFRHLYDVSDTFHKLNKLLAFPESLHLSRHGR